MSKDEATVERELPVVALGASAGGVNALESLFTTLPADTGAAFVVIQHLAPDAPSQLADIIARHTSMPVHTVDRHTELSPDTVYVTPPGRRLATQDNAISPVHPDNGNGHKAPIDYFFRSLAASHGLSAVGVVLSGTGDDGTLGVKAIKTAGGLTLAQQPDSAAFSAMPRNAITTHVIDHIVELDQVGSVLEQYFSQIPQLAEGAPDVDDEELTAILDILRTRLGRDFRHYKRNMVSRRVVRRMGLAGIGRLPDYQARLEADDDELDRLYYDLLISVTDFFRDPEAYEALAAKVLPPILEDGDGPVRIWVPACATGEEAYSLAIVAHEAMEAHNQSRALQIFATDIDQRAVDVARAGLYPHTIEADVSPERLRRFFKSEDHHYRIGGLLRESVTFAPQDVATDPPYSRLHLISCRNLLIYLDSGCQQRVRDLFHFALRDGGYLFLGSSETVGDQTNLFKPVDNAHRLYQRLNARRREPTNFPIGNNTGTQMPMSPTQRSGSGASIDQQAQDLMLREYVPPSVLVDRRGDIVCSYGATGQYLALPTGQARMELLQMAAEDIRNKLRATLFKAWRDEEQVHATVMREHAENGARALRISVRPLKRPQTLQGLCLVTFEPAPTPDIEAAAEAEESSTERRLAEELSNTQADLQETVQALEASNEDLKSSNEEVLSMNEELQSSNEELETSKEELQSANEELSTVNTELRDKINALERANDDLANLFAGLDAGILFLDLDLCIKRFTPAITPLINLLETDLGRPLRDIQLRFDDPELLTEANAILRDRKRREAEVVTEDGHRYLRRTLPYCTADDRIEGVVMTFTDITELGQALASARQSDEQLRLLADALPVLIAFIDSDHRFTSATTASTAWLGQDPEALHGMPMDKALGARYDEHIHRHVQAVLSGQRVTFDMQLDHRELGARHVNIIFVPETGGEDGDIYGFHMLVTDITAHKRQEAERLEDQRQFARISRNITLNEMASMMAHQINQPLGAISSYVGALRRQLDSTCERPQELVTKIGEQAQNAAEILRNLRNFVSDEGGSPEPVDINALIRRVITLAETQIDSTGAAVQLDLAAILPELHCSRVQIEQILLNLIGNALEAMNASEPGQLTLTTQVVDSYVEIHVSDTGCGIPQEDINRLFEPSYTTKERGLGMGLSVCRTIVKNHDGTLWAESSEAGSVFTVCLPASGGEESA